MMTRCRECGEAVSTNARLCPHCGAPGPARWRRWVVAGVVLASLVLLTRLGAARVRHECQQALAYSDSVTAAAKLVRPARVAADAVDSLVERISTLQTRVVDLQFAESLVTRYCPDWAR